MDTIINKRLIKIDSRDLVEKQSAQLVIKETTEIEL